MSMHYQPETTFEPHCWAWFSNRSIIKRSSCHLHLNIPDMQQFKVVAGALCCSERAYPSWSCWCEYPGVAFDVEASSSCQIKAGTKVTFIYDGLNMI